MQVMNDDISPTLREQMKHHEPIVCYAVGADLTWQGCSGLTQTATTLDTAARTLSKSQPKTCALVCYSATVEDKQGHTEFEVYSVDMGGGKSSVCVYKEQSPTLACTHYGEPVVLTALTKTKQSGMAGIEELPNSYWEIKEFVKDNNRNIDHQQDILFMQDEVCGSLAAGTHAAGGHLIKVIQWIKK